jgi:hypothetical protein
MNSSFGASFLSKFDFEGGEECLRVKKLVILGELSVLDNCAWLCGIFEDCNVFLRFKLQRKF